LRTSIAVGLLVASCGLLPSSPETRQLESNPASGGEIGAGTAGEGGSASLPAGAVGVAGPLGNAGEGGNVGEGGEHERTELFPDDLESALPLFALTMKQGPAQMDRRDFELFWVGEGGEARHLTRDASGFHETGLGETTTVPPVALSRIDEQLELFVAKDTGGVVIKSFRDGRWQSESKFLAGPVLGSLAVASYAFDEIDLLGVDELGTVQHLRWRADKEWNPDWAQLSGVEANGNVAVVARLQDELRLFVRNTDGELWTSVLSPAAAIEESWALHPKCGENCPCNDLRDPPVVTTVDGSRIDLAFVRQDDSVWHMAWDMGANNQWDCIDLGVSATGGAHLKMNANGLPTLLRLSGANVLASDWSVNTRSFGDWHLLPLEVTDLTIAGSNRTITHVFGRSSDGAIQYRAWETE
jgi:hypothetical protein